MEEENGPFIPDALTYEDLDGRTDRELLERIAVDTAATYRAIAEVRAIAETIKGQVEPMIDAISSSPMLKMLLPKGMNR